MSDDDPFGDRVSLAALDAAWPLMGADRLEDVLIDTQGRPVRVIATEVPARAGWI